MTSSPDDPTPQAEGAETPTEASAPARKPATKRSASSSAGAKKTTGVKSSAPKSAAAKTAASKSTAAKSTSAKTAATKSTSPKSTAAKAAGTKVAPAKTTGAKAAPAKSTAAKSSSPAKSSTASKTPAAKTPAVKKSTAARPAPTKAAAEKAAPTSEVVVEPTPAASVDPAAARTASAAWAAAVKNTAARTTSPKRPSATTTKPSTAAAKTTAAKAAAAKTAAAKASAAKTTAKTAAAKTAAAKAAAAKAAAAKAAEAAAAEAKAAEAEAAAEAQPDEPSTTPAPTVSAQVGESDTASAEVATSDDDTPESATRVEDPTAIAESPSTESTVETSDTALPVTKEPALEDSRVADVEVVEVVEGVTAEEPPAEVVGAEAAEPATEAIRIRGLVKQFGENRAVDGIDLTVPAASFYGIVGPNGAGKTTTLSIVAGLLRADEGSVLICGIDQASEPLAAKRVMGVLPDRLRTFDRLTGRQLLYYYGLLRGLAADVIEKRTGDLARAFDLGDSLNRVVSDYSAGMTKKIMLAGAMIHSPRVLVLDEPFESVDPVSSAVILDILRAYVSHGGTVILSSHGMDLVERVCSRVAIIVNGEVLAEGTIDEVRAGQTLESRFVELAGSSGEVEGLEWLHTFSD